MAPTLDAIRPLGTGRRGRPRERSDKAYDAKARRQECRTRGIVLRIARKGIENSQKLGRHRWSWSGLTLGSTASAACPSATSAEPTSTTPSQASPPASSPSTKSDGSVRRSKSSMHTTASVAVRPNAPLRLLQKAITRRPSVRPRRGRRGRRRT
ncbi:hypothetical protein HNR51_005205 [Methylorubrum thiocyanatum]|uniref:Transposase n=1 Tax=Methylorubrum thiocyanatum TaxID=47958 RepID=A0AA40S7P9_9HYPH|nr:hypothetical protein [Methylorubrum thiocyanatum]